MRLMGIRYQGWCWLLLLCSSLVWKESHKSFTSAFLCGTRHHVVAASSASCFVVLAAEKKEDGGGKRRSSRTASQQERMDEEQRRLSRKNDVIIGKTSAIAGAKDFELNIEKTEMEWRQQATPIECQIREYTQQAMDALHMYQLKEAKEAFDRVYELKPDAYCWHKGIVEYYLGDYEEASIQFQNNAIRFESKYGESASEERIWACATHLKYRQQYQSKKANNDVLPSLEYILDNADANANAEDVPKERRKVLRIARDLFESSLRDDAAGVAMARARLRATALVGQEKKLDYKLWKLSSWYYLGLHYDAIGDEKESQQCMKMAIQQSSPAARDIIHTLPILHMIVRDWFDDDDMSDPENDDDASTPDINLMNDMDTLHLDLVAANNNNNNNGGDEETSSSAFSRTKAGRTQAALQSNADRSRKKLDQAVIVQSVQDTIMKMKLVELKAALKKRGIKNSGAKQTLQERLLQSMMEDIYNEM